MPNTPYSAADGTRQGSRAKSNSLQSREKTRAPIRDFVRVGGLAAALVSIFVSGCWIRTFDATKRPDIILVTMDTVRADHLELYGAPRPTAPNLTTLSRSGITFTKAAASAPWTLPSMASIHTGRPPSEHGAMDNASPIASNKPTIAEVLKTSGYRTQAVVSHVFTGQKFGFDRGFDVFDQSLVQGHGGSSSQQLTEAALKHFTSDGPEGDDAPTLLWVHYFDPHYSYERHEEYGFATGPPGKLTSPIVFQSPDGTELLNSSRTETEFIRAVYDEEIAHTDHWIGALIEGVRDSNRDRPAIFVVTADHGEALLERDRLGHGKDLYDEFIRVPLVIGGDIERSMWGLTVGRAVETASIATTVARLARLEDDPFPGVNLIDTALSHRSPTFVFAEGSYARGRDQRKLAVLHGTIKLIRHIDDDRVELYNLSEDKVERHNLVDDPKYARPLKALLEASEERFERLQAITHPDRNAADEARDELGLSPDERAKLEGLGYIEPATPR